MIDIREILVRIFSAIFLSMCTGSCMFVFWMALRKFFADKIRPKVYDLILKIILIAYYVPAGYLLVNIFFDNGYVFDFTGTIIKAFYAISLFWLAGAIATVLKFGERTFRIRREKERCFPCKMYVQKIFEDCKRELGIRRSIEVLQGYRIQIPMTAGILKPCVFLPVEDMEEEQLKTCIYHELTHYCHRDLWYKMLLRICASIYWFNPFLLIMLKEADKDIENLCDTAVVRRVNKKEHKLYRQLLLRTVAMENQIPYVTASLNDSEMVFKDRILYMVNIRKLRKGILPGILVTLLLAGGNLVFNVSAGTDTVSVETEKSGIEKNADPEKNNVPDYAPFSEMVTMQKAAETQDEGGVTENTDTEDSVDEEEKADAETNDEPAMENSGQVSETTDDGITSDNNGSVSSYENLPAGVPYTSGFSTTSGVASIVAPGGGDEESRVLYDNGDGTYSDYYGSRYSYQGDGNWADANGNSYRTWNDEGYHFGNQLEQHELQGSNGTVNVIETTNGDYYYCDADGVGYTDNGDGTWTDENGNIYTE